MRGVRTLRVLVVVVKFTYKMERFGRTPNKVHQ
jgi:hypothetical protein